MLYLRDLTIILVFSPAAVAQTFSSGSIGADGAFNGAQPTATVQLPASGVLNYTTVNIASNCTLNFLPNPTNTRVVMLAQGTVNVAGIINIDATGSAPGPGGFYGGAPGQPGLGPGGGQPVWSGQQNGTWLGPLSLVPNIGGSGGGGTSECGNTYGGNGGGAITIASSTSISITGEIEAYWSSGNGCPPFNSNTLGASGAIRLVANAVSVSVSGYLGASIARLEAPLGNVVYAGSGVAPVISPINPEIVPTHPPSLTIVSIGGYPVPSYSGSSFSSIDLLLPNQMADPIPVVVQGTNVPGVASNG